MLQQGWPKGLKCRTGQSGLELCTASTWHWFCLAFLEVHIPKNCCWSCASKMIRKLRPKLPWITEKEEQEIKLKHSLFRKFKKSRLQEDRVAFQRQRNKVTQLLRRAERRYTTTLFRSSRSSTVNLRHPLLVLCKINDRKNNLPINSWSYHRHWHNTARWCGQSKRFQCLLPEADWASTGKWSSPGHHKLAKKPTWLLLYSNITMRSLWHIAVSAKEEMDGMASQLTCYVCVPLVLQRV